MGRWRVFDRLSRICTPSPRLDYHQVFCTIACNKESKRVYLCPEASCSALCLLFIFDFLCFHQWRRWNCFPQQTNSLSTVAGGWRTLFMSLPRKNDTSTKFSKCCNAPTIWALASCRLVHAHVPKFTYSQMLTLVLEVRLWKLARIYNGAWRELSKNGVYTWVIPHQLSRFSGFGGIWRDHMCIGDSRTLATKEMQKHCRSKVS